MSSIHGLGMRVHTWNLLFDAVLGCLAPPPSTPHTGMSNCCKDSPGLRWSMADHANMLQLPFFPAVVE
jgi:hypothetical protein